MRAADRADFFPGGIWFVKIEGAEARGALRPGMRVVEYTGGSTGSSLAMVCAAKKYPFVVLSSDAFAREKLLHHHLII